MAFRFTLLFFIVNWLDHLSSVHAANVNNTEGSSIQSTNVQSLQKLAPQVDHVLNGLNTTVFSGQFRSPSRFMSRGEALNESSLHHLTLPLRQNSRSGSSLTPEIQSHCFRQAACRSLSVHPPISCFGVSLTYKATSFSLVGMNDSSFEDIESHLLRWSRLQRVPRCWAVLQALLCAVFLPHCEGGFVSLPSQELCKATRGPCRLLDKYDPWPLYLSCQDESLFPTECKQEVKMKFNTSSGHCHAPLVETEQAGSSFPLVEGCGLQCHHPLVTREQHKHVHSFIAISGSVCLICNLFAVFTFLIDWHSSRRYPAVIVCYINFCYLMACTGWLAQFSSEARTDIVCNNDGTLRKEQPNTTETWSCAIVFILIYAFLMSAALWFVVLSYAWHISFNRAGISYQARKSLQNKAGYIHVVVWSLAAILTVSIMAMGLVEGNSVYGICFVSYSNWTLRAGFVLVPVVLSLLAGTFFLIRGLMSLLRVKFGSNSVTSEKVRMRINSMILKIGLFMILIFTAVIVVIVCHVHEYMNKDLMDQSLQDYVMCLTLQLESDSSTPCRSKVTPNLLLVYLQLLAMFGSGIAMSSWIWTPATLSSWKRFLQRLCGRTKKEPVKLKRHKMIAQAFAHRGEYSQVDPMAFSCDCTHEDPVGMNLESNSVASRELSSTWAAMLPKMLLRRGAIIETKKIRLRRHSSTSDLSQCTIHLGTLGSRRHSMDSQGSQQISEQEWLAHVHALARQRKRKTRKEREKLFRHQHRSSPWTLFSRRSSDTSQQTGTSAAPDVVFGKANQVSKATSTGDLPLFSAVPPVVIPVARPLVQRHPVIIPPFTHGMSDGPLMLRQPLLTPRHFTAPPANYGPRMFVPPYAYQAYPTFTLVPTALEPTEPILPLNPMPDSASEADFFPIMLSDSDYTDTGFRSATEEQQLLEAQKVVQSRIDAITCREHASACSNTSHCYSCSGKRTPLTFNNPLSNCAAQMKIQNQMMNLQVPINFKHLNNRNQSVLQCGDLNCSQQKSSQKPSNVGSATNLVKKPSNCLNCGNLITNVPCDCSNEVQNAQEENIELKNICEPQTVNNETSQENPSVTSNPL